MRKQAGAYSAEMPTVALISCREVAVTEVPERWYGCYGGSREGLFTRASNRHPAKMALGLAVRIQKQVALVPVALPPTMLEDPMAGIGTTLVVGAALGYRVVGVELERHFVDLARENVLRSKHGHPLGGCEIVQGDARELRAILEKADASFLSPPYPSEFRQRHPGTRGGKSGHEASRGGSFRGYAGGVVSPPYANSDLTGEGHFRSEREPNQRPAKDNRREGYAGGVTSPPYADQSMPSSVRASVRQLVKAGKMDEAVKAYRENQQMQIEKGQKFGMDSEEVIRARLIEAVEREAGNYGARVPDAVLTSQPFPMPQGGAKGLARPGGHPSDPQLGARQYTKHTTGCSNGQIGNLRDPQGDIDAVVSSPPYRDVHVGNPGEMELAAKGRAREIGTRSTGHGGKGRHGFQYSHDESGQIGNSSSDETYCAAMLRVYAQMAEVLKPGAVVCLVTKNPVRDGRIRRLDEDTIRLMKTVGFELIERQMAMLASEHGTQLGLDGSEKTIRVERKSFFKRLFEKKYPELRVDHEDVLWFRKMG